MEGFLMAMNFPFTIFSSLQVIFVVIQDKQLHTLFGSIYFWPLLSTLIARIPAILNICSGILSLTKYG